MAGTALVESQINIGRAIRDLLRKDKVLRAKSVGWDFDEDADEWRLVVSTDEVRRHGPRSAYRRISKILNRANMLGEFRIRQVVAVTPREFKAKRRILHELG
jgi:hypothetical protein